MGVNTMLSIVLVMHVSYQLIVSSLLLILPVLLLL